MKQTKAIEILSKRGASFEVKSFSATELTAEEVSVKLGIPLAQVYKTLVVRGERGKEMMALVSGDAELSLKKLAAAAGEKRVELVKIDELQRLIGYGDRVDRFAVSTSTPAGTDSALRAINAAAFGFQAYRSRDIAVETSRTFLVVSRFHRAIGVITMVTAASGNISRPATPAG